MDLDMALQNLYGERRRLAHIIAELQELQRGESPPPRPGPMAAAECEEVTERRRRRRTGRVPSRPAAI